MHNATDESDTRQSSVHQPWCDPAEHALAAGASETGRRSGCVGPVLEVGDAGGWLREGERGTEFVLDGFLPGIALDGQGLRTLLRMTAPEAVGDLRAVLTRALAATEVTPVD